MTFLRNCFVCLFAFLFVCLFEQFRICQILVVQAKSHQAAGEKCHSSYNKTRMFSTNLVIKHSFSPRSLKYLHLWICLNNFLRTKKIGCSVTNHNLFNTHEMFGLPLLSFSLFAVKLSFCFSQVG